MATETKKTRKKPTKKIYRISLYNKEQGFYAGNLKFTNNYEEAKIYSTSSEAYNTQKILGKEINLIMLKEIAFRDI